MERYKGRLLVFIFTMGLAITSTCFVLLFFYSIGLNGILPVLPSFLIAIGISIALGVIFNKQILKPKSKTHSFFMGMGLLLLSLPLFDIGAVYFIKDQFQGTQIFHASISEYMQLYLMILFYSLIFIGSWLSLVCGFGSIILNQLLPQKN